MVFIEVFWVKWEKYKENAWEFTKEAGKAAIEGGAKIAGEMINEYVRIYS